MLKYSPQSAISRLQNYSLSWLGSWLLILLSFASPPSPATSPGDQLNFSPPDARSNAPPLSVTEKSAIAGCGDLQWANPLPTGHDLKAVAYGSNKLVAVGDYGTVVTSPDGVTWTARTSGVTENLAGVVWGGNKFVAVGANGKIITSPDGVTWTSRISGTTSPLNAVTWGGNKFVAIGNYYNSDIFTSPDGITWTQTFSTNYDSLYAVTWGNNKFVAVGSDGKIFTSPDGVTWTSRTSGTTYSLNAVAWGGNKFVAIGNSNYDGYIYTSPDGITWTQTFKSTYYNLYGVTWGNNKFVAVGDNNIIFTSPDGVTWTWHTLGTMSSLKAVTWVGNKFVAVGGFGNILTSVDAITWTDRRASVTDGLSNVTWGNNQFVAVGDDILTSPNGITWTVRATTTSLYSVVWGNNQFVAVGGYGKILTSANGTTWTLRMQGQNTDRLNSVAWNGSQFVAVGAGSEVVGGTSYTYSLILTSPNGITWTARNFESPVELRDVTWGNNKFVAVGTNTILTSPDGITWTTHAAGWLRSVTWGNNQFVAMGYDNILTSSDGITWVARTIPAAYYIYINDVIWSGNRFMAVGYDYGDYYGIVLTSPDAITWTTRQVTNDIDLYGVAAGNNRVAIVGYSGAILTSACITNTLATFALTIQKAGTGQGTITSVPAGINCGTTCSKNFVGGSTINLAATPATGSMFSGFSGNADCNDWQVTMNNPLTCTATFTLLKAPTVVTNAATNITATAAQLNGSVNSNGITTNAKFDFGLTTAYGTSVWAYPSSIYGTTTVAVSGTKTGLTCNTTYNYRVTATNVVGTSNGLNKTFKTVACGPDFVVTNVVLTPVKPTANGTFTAEVTVENQGTVAGDGKNLDVWLNQATVPICGATGTTRQVVGSLAVNATKTLTFTGLSAGAAGAKTFRAFVDSGCGTVEANEANNQMIKVYTVQ